MSLSQLGRENLRAHVDRVSEITCKYRAPCRLLVVIIIAVTDAVAITLPVANSGFTFAWSQA